MNNFIQTIKVLTPKELKQVNEYVDTLDFGACRIFSTGTPKVDEKVRTSTGTSLDDNCDVAKLMTNRLNDALLVYKQRLIEKAKVIDSYPVPVGMNTTCYREGIQILDYAEGQRYREHFDVATDPNNHCYHRHISVVLYLSKDFEGGHTAFSHKKYKPKPGYALFFPSNWCFPHQSKPVKSGKKRVAVTWYYVNDTRNG